MMVSGFGFGGILCLVVFILTYIFILTEEFTHLRKSKPAIFGACLIWAIIAVYISIKGMSAGRLHHELEGALTEFAGLFLFLLAAMTYISALEERDVFNALRAKLVKSGLNYRQLFWATGVIAFFLSPIADNLTTALILGTVAVTIGVGNRAFITIACVNIVNAANAGGTFSPFGDITTLMVWQSGHVQFFEFFALFIPSAVNFLVPAAVMHFFIPNSQPPVIGQTVEMKAGAKRIIILGLLTIAAAVTGEQLLGLPPFMGMMAGLSALMIFSWYLKRQDEGFDIFKRLSSVEWDTLLFFFGVIFSVAGLAFLGYLQIISTTFYQGIGAGPTNIGIGLLSSVLGNIPLLFGVLQMNPQMDHFQWLLITLTTGVGGSLLSIGSAAGVGLMGVAKGHYTFMSHLKWAPVLLAGYIAAIGAHYLLN